MNQVNNIKNITILGSTGSIGTQTLDIIRNNPSLFKAKVITANNNWEFLARQAIEFKPSMVVIANPEHYLRLKDALANFDIEVRAGIKEIETAASFPESDMVVTAMVGYSGLLPTVEAIKAGKKIALANKETLVVAGEIITRLVKEYNTEILPVDSEHSAIFQCLVGEKHREMKKILLTASGGPFRKLSFEKMKNVTVSQALNHPNWNMGAKVTIDSASMMNKGFEMIEAKWLFNCPPENIEILVHPQSIVHSMVQFCDGSVKAQLGVPDMHIPISYALSYPARLDCDRYTLDWSKVSELTFEKPDFRKFPLLALAFEAIEKGGTAPCVLNAANEVAVKAFLSEKISFMEMPVLIRHTMEKMDFIKTPAIEDFININEAAVKTAEDWLRK